MRMRRVGLCAALLAALLLVGAGDALSVGSAAPPTLLVQVEGKGKVTGTGINCGNTSLQCYSAYSGAGPYTMKATAPSGWSFDHWTDDAGCGGATTCDYAALVDQTFTAVFKPNSATTATADFNVAVSGTGDVTNGGSTEIPIDCGTNTTCSATVLRGSTVTVVETPGTGQLFGGWGGACSTERPSCSVYIGDDPSFGVSATFLDSAPTTLTVTADGNGTVTGGGINCPPGGSCSAEEPATANVTLTATPQSGYAFTGWDGACSGTQTTCTVQMNVDRDVVAHFAALVPILITVNGNGKVTGAGITCGPGPVTCQGSSAPSTTILLTGTPATGTSVTWSGCTSISGNVCKLSVSTTPIAITATFAGGTPPPSTFTLSVSVDGNGYVTSSNGAIYCTYAGGSGCSASLSQNSSITLTAIPATGGSNNFTDWTDDCEFATATTCTITMNSAKVVGAEFQGTNTTYLLSAQVSGNGSGTISGAGLKCTGNGTGCSAQQAASAEVTITATPAAGSSFTGWGGACSGTSSTCKVAMTAARTVTATFGKSSPTAAPLSLSVTGGGTVKGTSGLVCTAAAGKSTTCTHDYPIGAKVTLSATPAKGLVFTGWKGACSGTKPTCSLTLSAAEAVTATFGKAILAASHKPTVAKVSGGYRVHLYYLAGSAGTLKLNVTRSGKHVLTHSKHVAAGKGSVLVPLKRKGHYVFTLTLTAKSGAQTIRWLVAV